MSLSSMLSLMNLLMPMYTMMSIRDTSSFRGFDSAVLLGASVVVCFCVVLSIGEQSLMKTFSFAQVIELEEKSIFVFPMYV